MFKRRTGKIIIFTLVICGLAGAATNSALTYYERRSLVKELKQSENDFLHQLEGLTADQLTYRPEKNKKTIQEIIASTLETEKSTWRQVDSVLKKSYDPLIKKETVSEILLNKKAFFKLIDRVQPNADFKLALRDLQELSTLRNNRIQYIRITTQDLHSPITSGNGHSLTAYDYIRLLNKKMEQATHDIQVIKETSNP